MAEMQEARSAMQRAREEAIDEIEKTKVVTKRETEEVDEDSDTEDEYEDPLTEHEVLKSRNIEPNEDTLWVIPGQKPVSPRLTKVLNTNSTIFTLRTHISCFEGTTPIERGRRAFQRGSDA